MSVNFFYHAKALAAVKKELPTGTNVQAAGYALGFVAGQNSVGRKRFNKEAGDDTSTTNVKKIAADADATAAGGGGSANGSGGDDGAAMVFVRVLLSYEGKPFVLDTVADGERMAQEIAATAGITDFSLGGGKTVSLEAMEAIARQIAQQPSLRVADFSDCFTRRKEDCIYPAMDALGHALLKAGGKVSSWDLGENAVSLLGARTLAPHVARMTNLTELKL
jgi:hypothetical protein